MQVWSQRVGRIALAIRDLGGEAPAVVSRPSHPRASMKPFRPALLLLALAAACGTPEDAVPGSSAHGGAPTDTLAPDSGLRDPRVEAVQRRLEQAEKDAEARNREALDAMDSP